MLRWGLSIGALSVLLACGGKKVVDLSYSTAKNKPKALAADTSNDSGLAQPEEEDASVSITLSPDDIPTEPVVAASPTPTPTPSNLTATPLRDLETNQGALLLDWRRLGSPDYSGWRVAYNESALAPQDCDSGTVVKPEAIGAKTSFLVKKLKLGTQYAFRVCPIAKSNGQAWLSDSAEVTATPVSGACYEESPTFVTNERGGCREVATNLTWYHAPGVVAGHGAANKFCTNLVVKDLKKWRLASPSELAHAAKNGGQAALNKNHPGNKIHWSSLNKITTISEHETLTQNLIVNMDTGKGGWVNAQTAQAGLVCVTRGN